MIDEAILDCSHPLFFDTGEEVEEMAYGRAGTCFTLKKGAAFFLLTAKHCLVNQRWRPDQVFVLLKDRSRRPIPLHRELRPRGESKAADFVVFEIDSEKLGADCHHLHAFDIQMHPPIALIPGVSRIAVRGFPTEHNEIDYDNLRLRNRNLSLSGTYTGPGAAIGTGMVQFDDVSLATNHDGLSGSPVFTYSRRAGVSKTHFAGIHIEGGELDRRKGCFIEAKHIIRALDRI